MNKEATTNFNKKNVRIKKSKNGYGLGYFTTKEFKKGEIVMSGFGKIIDHQTAHISVQIGTKKHYLPSVWTGRYWNHSCEPNTRAETQSNGFPNLIAVTNIKKDQEVTFSYWQTEYEWSKGADENHIRCMCHSRRCRGTVLSFSQLKQSERREIIKKKLCSNYLLNAIVK